MQDELATIWSRTQDELRASLPASNFDHWLAPLRPVGLSEDCLYISGSDRVRAWVERRYLGLLVEALGRAGAAQRRVAFVSDRPEEKGAVGEDARPEAPLSAKYTFEQFVIGPGNRFAHSVALHVAESPTEAWNPVLFVGEPGVGKTHLLGSIASYVRSHGQGLRVRYTTAEAFTGEFVQAVRQSRTQGFKDRYRGVDVLLIDDVQFLEGKQRTEEEFFHTFNTLHESGSQLVFSADRSPDEMTSLANRVRQRFEWGLIAPIGAPDLQTRIRILEKRARLEGLDLADPLTLDAIARRVSANVRQLEGALIRVVARASVERRPLDCELVAEVLGDRGRAADLPDVERIKEAVCDLFGLTAEEMISTDRRVAVSYPRQVAMYLSRELTDLSLPRIGAAFGSRDHTTVLHAWRKIAERVRADRETYELAERLTTSIRTGAAVRDDRSC